MGVGAFSVALVVDGSVATAFTLMVTSTREVPAEQCLDIGCALSENGGFAKVVAVLLWVFALVGLGIAAALISVVTVLVSMLSKWQPRGGTGTVVAIGLGLGAAIAGPLVAAALVTGYGEIAVR